VANAREDTGPRKCDVIDIYEEDGGARRQLGRFVHDWRDRKVHPDPRKPGPGRSDDALRAIIKAVLGEQAGEDALKQHFVD
jgi:cytochrome c551/c552